MMTPDTRSEGSLEEIIRASLGDFADFLSGSSWWGREREMISLYAFGFLRRHCKTGSVIHDPTQIGIEVAVPQVRPPGVKALVCKDLVIWPERAMNYWSRPRRNPLAVFEWKTKDSKKRQADIEWLSRFSARRADFVGFSVVCRISPTVLIDVALVRSGELKCKWCIKPSAQSVS